MSRLEEIKERLDGAYYEGSTITDDISYLVSKLEIAQKCLQEVFESEGLMYVKTALDKIKEEAQ